MLLPQVSYLTPRTLSPKAEELVQFDVDSIRQVVSSQHARQPTLWLADPDAYEQNGRILRDSDSPRLLAYSKEDQTLYANDGCNSCTHHLKADIAAINKDALRSLAAENKIRPELIEKIAELCASGS
jgi:hypothetical protein